MRLRHVPLFLLAAGTVWADAQFTVRQTTRNDIPAGKGQCDIRLRIDQQAEVELRGQQVFVRVLRGAEARDEGSECNLPVPRNPANVRFEKRDGRGEMRLMDETRRGVVVAINDSDGGAGRYHFRLSWDDRGEVFDRRNNRRDDISNDTRGRRNDGVFDDTGGRRNDGIFDDTGGRRNDGVFDDTRPGRQAGSLSRTLHGDGDLRYLGRTERLRNATINLRRNGRFQLNVGGDTRDRIEGTWRQGRRNEIDLAVDRVRSARAQGRGVVMLRGNEIERITLDALDDRNERLDLTFRSDRY